MTIGWYLEEEQKEQMDFAHQEEMIKQFQALLEEVDENLKASFRKFHQGNCNPTETLIRLLEVSNWNVHKAHKVLLDCLQWSVQNDIDNIFAAIADVERLYKAYNKSDGSNVPTYDQLDYVAEGIGRDIAAGFIVPELKVTNGNCLIMSQLLCPDEYFAVKEWVKCYPCIRVEAFEGALKNMKNKFGISDFLDFVEAWKAGDKKTIPLYLEYLHNVFGCNVTAITTHCNDMIALPLGLFYAAIDEMHKMQLQDITNEDVILKWGCVTRDAKKMGLDVEFAEEHLKKIAHAYFLSKGPTVESNKEELCSLSERESFDDGSPLSKGLLPFASSEQSA